MMEYFNPWDAKGVGRPGKEKVDWVNFAAYWEGLRHNPQFKQDIKTLEGSKRGKWWEDYPDILDRLREGNKCVRDIFKFLRPNIYTPKDNSKVPLDVSKCWRSIPNWFKIRMKDLMILPASSPTPTAHGVTTLIYPENKELHFKYPQLADILIKIAEEDGLESVIMALKELKGRLVELPNIICSEKEADEVLQSIRPMLQIKHHNLKEYPTKVQWDHFLIFKKASDLKKSEDEALAMVTHKFNKPKWDEAVKGTGNDPETLTAEEGSEILGKKKVVTVTTDSALKKNLRKVENYIKCLYPSEKLYHWEND